MLNDSSQPYPRADHHHHLLLLPLCDVPSPEPPRRMDHQQQQQQASSSGRGGPTTPRRQLQGPRPPRLNVRMESHAIKKPPAAGPQQPRRDHQQQPGRAPVIIYDASPKVIHAKPSEFMALVQRLTGPTGSSSAPPPAAASEQHHNDDDMDMLGQPFLPPELLLSPSAAMSPAARLATIERSVRPLPADPVDYDALPTAADDTLAAVLGAPARPGILSPLPSSLPPAAASGTFSPQPFLDPGCISWLNELSPILRAASASGPSAPAQAGGNYNVAARAPPPPHAYYSDPFVPSPRNLLATPTIPSPTTCAEFFGSLPDF